MGSLILLLQEGIKRLQNLTFIGKFQQMVSLVKFVISGIHKILFPLCPAY